MSPLWRVPSISSFRRLMDRRNVDLPHPEGPIRAVTERGWMVRSMLLSACFRPYQNENWRASIVPDCASAGLDAGSLRSASGSTATLPSVIRSGR